MKRLLPFLLAAAPLAVSAQSQRTVLLEHFTQASCGPCATYNPRIATDLAALGDEVVTIKYHTWWPGTDPMYNHNMADVQNRAAYYSINSVPSSVMDGRKTGSGANAGHPAYWNQDTVHNHAAVQAPYTMRLRHRYILTGTGNDSVEVTAVVHKTGDVGANTQKLQIVVIERDVTFTQAPGSNGEKEFPYVMKKMLPSADGTTLDAAMAIGDSAVHSYKWALANVYSISQIAAVAFVQDDVSKRVHQAGYSRPYSPVNFSVLNVPRFIISGATSTNNYNVDVTTEETTPTNFVVYGPTTQVAGTTSKLLDANGNEVDSLPITISASMPASVGLRVNVTNGANLHGSISLNVKPADRLLAAFAVAKQIPLYSQANILTVNRDPAGASSTTAATTGRGAYAITAVEYAAAPADLFSVRNYSKIIISSGNQYSALISQQASDSLKQFLNDGGDLAYIGTELGYSAYLGGASYLQDLYENYLGATFVSDGPGANGADGSVTLEAVPGDTVSYQVINATLSSASYDQVALTGDGIESFTFTNTGTPGGIRTHVGSRHTVYLVFPFNSITPVSNRNRLMKNIIDYFDDAFVMSANGKVALMPMAIAPNPTTGKTSFVHLEAGDQIRVTDMLGRTVAQGKATTSVLTMDLSAQPAGMYLVSHIRQGAVVATEQLSLTR